MQDKTSLTVETLTESFVRLGLGRGEAVLVHGSLSSLGHVEGGAAAVIEALLKALGPYGTVLGPTLTGSRLLSVENPPTIVANETPCWTGALPESVRLRPGAIRSFHPTHSVAGVGPLADWLCATHHHSPSPCGWLSPYMRLAMRKGKVLMLGVSLDHCTTFHSCEEMAAVPFVCQPDVAIGSVILPDGKRLEIPVRLHSYAGPERDYPAFEPILEERGVLSVGQVGNARTLLIDSMRLIENVLPFLARDPYAVTAQRRVPLDPAILDHLGPARLWETPEGGEE